MALTQKTLLNLLIVEDDQLLASSLKMMAPDCFKVYLVQKSNLIPDHVFFHAALVDMHIEVEPGEVADGPGVIQLLTKKNPQIEVVAMSGHLDRTLMEKSIHAGAQRFLAKPLLAEEVKSVLEKIEAYWSLRLAAYEGSKIKSKLIGTSVQAETLRKKVAQLKHEKTPILVEGETGVGKEIIANLLNQQEGQVPFVAVNCSALTETLFESEFFGHLKGSFTGADSNKLGFAEAAHGGDLFLDEIEALPLSQQAKLLRFLESGEIRKVGAKETMHVEVRIIAASNIPLKRLVEEKKFREDLYFRLSSQRIEIPALKERKDDITELAQYFLELEKPKRNKEFEPSAFAALKKYSWPGNIRELKRVCEQLVLTSPLPVIRQQDVEQLLAINPSPSANEPLRLNQTLDDYLKIQEKRFIEYCLQQTKDIEKSCDILKVSKSNLYKKIKDLGITYA
ncbi:MAG: sigma-54-dependent Fis family transcriptional regulator [Bdellovibrionaceae bacterium]|nr:sigma-54-dependent Fis family transcriptional regulator [Bdellovibrio sp.]